MKLLRVGPPGAEKPAALDAEGRVRDLSGLVEDIADVALTPKGLSKLRAIDLSTLPIVAEPARIGACVGRVGKLIGIGLNYHDHANEVGAKPPREPILFFKATSAICGPNDDVRIPPGSEKTDWEVELGVVIGSEARFVGPDQALDYVAGYCVVNDISERAYQLERGGQWVKGKSADTFAPIGPWLVTTDEMPDPQSLPLWLEVDGVRRQNGNTQDMIFGVRELISYVSQFMSLQPGDIICTGTPAGVGMGQKPEAIFLKPGQEMALGVEGLGAQRQRTIST